MSRSWRDSPSWRPFLDCFHQDRPGITEAVLVQARSDGIDPYQWLLEPLPRSGRVLDLACGSAPISDRSAGGGWVGIDRSAAELAVASERGAAALIRADITQLPVRSGSFPAAVCSMAIMIVQPLDTVLGELHRVLTPGAVAVLLLPGTLPLTLRDLARYGRLMVALHRSRLGYPNDRDLARLAARMSRAGLTVIDDRRRRFALPLTDRDTGRVFVRSLYLPGVPEARVRVASELAASWQGSEIGIPLRRVTLRRGNR